MRLRLAARTALAQYASATAPLKAVKKSEIAGGTACATKTYAAYSVVGQAVPPAQWALARFLLHNVSNDLSCAKLAENRLFQSF